MTDLPFILCNLSVFSFLAPTQRWRGVSGRGGRSFVDGEERRRNSGTVTEDWKYSC